MWNMNFCTFLLVCAGWVRRWGKPCCRSFFAHQVLQMLRGDLGIHGTYCSAYTFPTVVIPVPKEVISVRRTCISSLELTRPETQSCLHVLGASQTVLLYLDTSVNFRKGGVISEIPQNISVLHCISFHLIKNAIKTSLTFPIFIGTF